MTQPVRWTKDQIRADAAMARENFRQERFAEPLGAWPAEVDQQNERFKKLFDEHAVARPHDLTAADVPRIIKAGLLETLRYLPGPPISGDDLKTLADIANFDSSKLQSDEAASKRLLETIRKTVDPRRFPWLAEDRNPTDDEKAAAIFASAIMLAAQRLQTSRRNQAKVDQEKAAREHLKAHGFLAERLKKIQNYAQFPAQGIVSANEVQFGPKKADMIVRLWDDRMLALECKVSNSAVNSFKRLNDTTMAKYHAWINHFGTGQVVPAAILAGVYSPGNVVSAQADGLTIFWSHRIDDLGEFVESTRT